MRLCEKRTVADLHFGEFLILSLLSRRDFNVCRIINIGLSRPVRVGMRKDVLNLFNWLKNIFWIIPSLPGRVQRNEKIFYKHKIPTGYLINSDHMLTSIDIPCY